MSAKKVTVRDSHGAIVTRTLGENEVLITDSHKAQIKYERQGDELVRSDNGTRIPVQGVKAVGGVTDPHGVLD